MKVAYVQEWIVSVYGSEKVVKAMWEVFKGPIFTLVKKDEVVKELFGENVEVIPSKLQKKIKNFRSRLPFFPYHIEQFDVSDYDVVISSHHSVANGILTNSNQLHISYVHSPMRYAWDFYHQYIRESGLTKGLKGWLARWILHYLRIWDFSASARVDVFIANSKHIANRIKKIYRRKAKVIYPPVSVEEFKPMPKENYFIAVSRLVPYKRIDVAVEAFSKLGLKLLVVGEGPEEEKLKKIASKNVEFVGYVERDKLRELMAKARALIFPAEEDFGITPVEAQASGTPVIAYGVGGSAETIVDGETGILFQKQTPESLIEAVKIFLKVEDKFDTKSMLKNARRFSKDRFQKEFENFVLETYKEFKSQISAV